MSDKMNNKFGEIGTIRDILMGQQMDEYESKFEEIKKMISNLEEEIKNNLKAQDQKFTDALASLSKETNTRFEKLEQLLEKQVKHIQEDMDKNRKTDKRKLGEMFAKVGAKLMDEGK